MEILVEPSIIQPELMQEINVLINKDLSTNCKKLQKLRINAASYTFSKEGELYKKGYLFPWLRCLTPANAQYTMDQVLAGLCKDHTSGRTLSHKLVTMRKDFLAYVRICDKWQKNAYLIRKPPKQLIHISGLRSCAQQKGGYYKTSTLRARTQLKYANIGTSHPCKR